MDPTHAIIIPHYNDADRLQRCLEALFSSETGGTEVLVVDNGSSQPLDPLQTRFASAKFFHEPQKGAANARNRGVQESRAPQLIFLDADCVPAADWLAVAKQAGGQADIVGGAIDVFDETPPPRTGAQAFEMVFAFNYKDYIENKGFSVTANLVTSRAVFAAVGGFVHGMSEDAEWCLRARAKGFAIALEERMRVAHPTRSDWRALRRKWHRITREMYQTHITEKPGLAGKMRWLARAFAMQASIPLHIPRILRHRGLNGPGERLRAIGTLARLRLVRSYWMLRQVVGLTI